MPTGYRPNSPLPSGGQTISGGVVYSGNVQAGSFTPGAVSGTPAANTLYADNVVKGYAQVAVTGTTYSLGYGFNVSSVTDGSTGQFTINWDRDFITNNPVVVASALQSAGFNCYVVLKTENLGTTVCVVVDETNTTQDSPVRAMAIGSQ